MLNKYMILLAAFLLLNGMTIGCVPMDDDEEDSGIADSDELDGGDDTDEETDDTETESDTEAPDGGDLPNIDPEDSESEDIDTENTEDTDDTDDTEETDDTEDTEENGDTGDVEDTDSSSSDDTDSVVDYDYSEYEEMSQIIKNYDVVAYSANNIASRPLALTVGNINAKTSTISAGNAVWDEVLMHGSADDIAGTWVVNTGDAECPVTVTKEMIEQWGGFAVNQCGTASQIAFHFVPIS